MAKILRASVMRRSEWDKERDQNEWKHIRKQVLTCDNYTCVYCGWTIRSFQQVNHIGAEDNHSLDNLETVCRACHSVLHIGIASMNGLISAFDCKEDMTNMARIVHATRVLVSRKTPWPEIERAILNHYALPGGRVYTCSETISLANQMLRTIPPGEYRGYLLLRSSLVIVLKAGWYGCTSPFLLLSPMRNAALPVLCGRGKSVVE